MSTPYLPHSGRKKHYWRIRNKGFRELLIKKGWHLMGGYASKVIQGRVVIQFLVEKTDDYFLCSFQLKSDFWADIDTGRKTLDDFNLTNVMPN